MLRLFLIILLTCIFNSQSCAEKYYNSGDIKQLVNSYHALTSIRDSNAQASFFDCFPDTWLDFIRAEAFIADYDEEEFFSYVEAFGNLTAIDDTVYCAKLLSLCIGAQPAADGPNYLHVLLHKKMGRVTDVSIQSERLMQVILSLLSHKLKGEIISFWNFYWSQTCFEEDGGAANDKLQRPELNRLLKILRRHYPEMEEPMTIAYRYFHYGVMMH